MTTSVNKLSLKRFSEFMIAHQTNFDVIMDKGVAILAPLLDIDAEDLENEDISEVKSKLNDLKKLDDSLLDELLEQKLIKEFEFNGVEYFVAFTSDDKLYIKKKELDFITKIISKPQTNDELAYSRETLRNLHLLAAVIFRKKTNSWKEDKFNEESIRKTAEIFLKEMQAKHIFPYLELVKEKLQHIQ